DFVADARHAALHLETALAARNVAISVGGAGRAAHREEADFALPALRIEQTRARVRHGDDGIVGDAEDRVAPGREKTEGDGEAAFHQDPPARTSTAPGPIEACAPNAAPPVACVFGA